MNHVSYEKCKDCEHYGVWSERCWNAYKCPKDRTDHVPHYEPACRCIVNEKEEKINAENESLSEADKEKILRKLSYIKHQCLYNIGDDYDTRNSIYNVADEIRSIIEHKE